MQQASYKGPWGTMTPLEWGPPKCHTYDTKNGCELQSRYVSQTFKCLHIYKSLHIGHNMLLFLYWSPALNVTWREAKYCDLYSELTHPKCTHTAVNTHTHTHREHTPGAVGSYLFCGAGEQLGVRCLAQASDYLRQFLRAAVYIHIVLSASSSVQYDDSIWFSQHGVQCFIPLRERKACKLIKQTL